MSARPLKIVVINLERSGERREHMRRQLDAFDLDYEFFSAIDASKGQLEPHSRYDAHLGLKRLGRRLTPSEIGCFASHYLLWQRVADNGVPIIVMEDDVTLAADFVDTVQLAGQQLPSLHYLRLCGTLDARRYRVVAPLAGRQLIRYTKGPRGTQCYAITADGARALLRHAQTWIDAVDMYMDAFWVHGLPPWAIIPFSVFDQTEGDMPTLIERSRTLPTARLHKLRRESRRVVETLQRVGFNLRQRLREPFGRP